jgi:hypothetical protein
MRYDTISRFFLLLSCMVLLFSGCSDDPNPEPELFKGDFTVAVSDTSGPLIKYYSLSTGQEVAAAQKATTAWDLAFEQGRTIFTNGGETAARLGSGGAAQVWYTNNTTDFDAVVKTDAVTTLPTLLQDYTEDILRYNATTMTNTSELVSGKERILNVMTFIGYYNETTAGAGLSDTNGFSSWTSTNAGSADAAVANRHDTAFYNYTGMTNFYPTNQVYIIKHGNGQKYSKIQITGISYLNAGGVKTDTFTVKVENLP